MPRAEFSKARSEWLSPKTVIAIVALAVQFGVLVNRISSVERRLDELLTETRIARQEKADLDRRLAILEGKLLQP